MDTPRAISDADISQSSYLSGVSAHGSVTCSPVDTWKQIPSSVPSSPYVLVITIETKTGIIRWSFNNSTAPTSAGSLLKGPMSFALAGSEFIYVASTVNTDVVRWETKVI